MSPSSQPKVEILFIKIGKDLCKSFCRSSTLKLVVSFPPPDWTSPEFLYEVSGLYVLSLYDFFPLDVAAPISYDR